jgi:SAM-dependent methyltransferase
MPPLARDHAPAPSGIEPGPGTGTVGSVAELETSVRANSFGSVAGAYDRFRPGPPPAAVEWVLPSPAGTAVDLGAGTGALTRVLVARADRVIAVEPDVRMLEVLRRRSPGIPAVRSWAEQLPLHSGSVDAVTISSAWHWMDPDRSVDEAARVLGPGGILGVIWNGADRSVDWVTELLGTRDPSPGDREQRRSRHRFELPGRAPFTDLDHCTIAWTLPMTREDLVGLAGTYSSTIIMAPEERDRELARVRRGAEELVAGDVVAMPMRCRCWRAVRR